ncbi:hypothetical protein GCM10010377_19810 [Streptomyces viridiviolaceus]|nr:hypothetical protein GCM10010377_19810 [Streptomyces viridiviolaceus]
MRDEQAPRSGRAGGVPRVLGRQVHLFALAMLVDVGLAQEEVRVAGEAGERGARSAVPRVGQDPAPALGTQPVRLGVMPDGAGGEEQAAVAGRVSVVQRPEREDPGQEPGVGTSEEAREAPGAVR